MNIMQNTKFFLFGMGDREKYLYKNGELILLKNLKAIYKWDNTDEKIMPEQYCVELADGIVIKEDEEGLYIEQNSKKEFLAESKICLPEFSNCKYPGLMKVLHHEILINIKDGKPLPNLLVYPKPWHRDAAMMAMCLKKTGNLHLVKDWILILNEVFDRNNNGAEEPDNLGQVLYLISLVSDKSHPLVKKILDTIPRFQKEDYIFGTTDYAEHPVYQTKWLKFGLASLGLEDPYIIPKVFDSYSPLFWMDYKDEHVSGEAFSKEAEKKYPYLTWAEAHFHGWEKDSEYKKGKYPLTWETHSSEADFEKMDIISEEYASSKIAVPHSWHAAEMFLYFYCTT